jgi:hypothetical protein
MLEISKLEAAKRQLQTAIRLWFYDTDPISAHSLAYAAYEVIQAVSKARNPDRPDLLFDSRDIKPESQKQFNDAFRKAGNFFKHADRDPLDTLQFSPGITEIFIYYAIWGLQFAGEQLVNEFIIFQNWLAVSQPQLMSEEAREIFTNGPLIEHLKTIRALPKQQFFEVSLQTLRTG